MKPARIYAMFLRQMYLLRHNKTRFANIFIWIVLDVILWGFITRYLNIITDPGFDFVPALLGAVIFWDFMIRVQQGVMLAFFEDMWSQNFLNLFASPLTIKEYASSLVVTSIVTSIAGLAVMLLIAGPAFGFNILTLGLYSLPFLLILFIFGTTIGIIATAIVLRLGPAAEWFSWPIPFVLGPFAGVFYPVSSLPEFGQWIAKLIPPSYGFEGMREVLLSGTFAISQFWIGLGLGLVYLFLAYLFFVKTYEYTLRSGLLARFSAETP